MTALHWSVFSWRVPGDEFGLSEGDVDNPIIFRTMREQLSCGDGDGCPFEKMNPFLEFSIEDWDEMMENNAKSDFLMTRLVLPAMLERGYGVIDNTSSSAVRAATHLESLYCASKAAMNQLARALAVEYRDRGIRCNTICPSFVRTKHGEHEIEQLRA
jgi:NAD(P)-dependent dehydrogenase (short-subunit alcohol dehydrogenase family)